MEHICASTKLPGDAEVGFLDTSYKTEDVWICVSVCVHRCLCLELVTLDKVLAAVKQALGMPLAEGARQPPLPLLLTKTGGKKISIMAS